jgi:hypothetical protein
MTKPSRHHELVVLMRYSQRGRLLSAEHDLETGDLVAVAEAGLQQMTLVKSEIDRFLPDAKRRRGQV